MNRAPGGPTCLADIMPPQQGVQATRGRREIVERIFASAAQVTHGFVFDRWDIDRCDAVAGSVLICTLKGQQRLRGAI
jgi:hypothetical protein